MLLFTFFLCHASPAKCSPILASETVNLSAIHNLWSMSSSAVYCNDVYGRFGIIFQQQVNIYDTHSQNESRFYSTNKTCIFLFLLETKEKKIRNFGLCQQKKKNKQNLCELLARR